MKRPNKRAIAQAIFVTSHGYPTRYFLKVEDTVSGLAFPVYDYLELDGAEIGSLAAANTLVRAMREHVEKVWHRYYADHLRMLRGIGIKRSAA